MNKKTLVIQLFPRIFTKEKIVGELISKKKTKNKLTRIEFMPKLNKKSEVVIAKNVFMIEKGIPPSTNILLVLPNKPSELLNYPKG